MSSSLHRNQLGYETFVALNNGDLKTFTQLINRPDADLTITDHCDGRLENLLGGPWVARDMQFGRYEGNTLLNCALSMERLDFAMELIKIYNKTKKDIGIDIANFHQILPVEMVLMVNCEYLQHYDSMHSLVPMKLFSMREQAEAIEKARQILDFLLHNTHAEDMRLLVALTKYYRLPIQPLLLWDMIAFCRTKWNDSDVKLARAIQLAIVEELNHLDQITPLDVEISTLETDLNETKFDVTDIDRLHLDQYHQEKAKLHKILSALKELRSSTQDNLTKITHFVKLLKEDAWLSRLLNETLTHPTFYIFDIVHKLGNRTAEQKFKAQRLLDLLITPDMLTLKNARGESLQFYLDKYDFTIGKTFGTTTTLAKPLPAKPIKTNTTMHVDSKTGTKSTPKTHTTKLNGTTAYKYRGQMKSAFKGAKACSVVAFAMISFLLRKTNAEFAHFLKDKKLVDKELNACVLDGAHLNEVISKSDTDFFDSTKRTLTRQAASETYKAIAKLRDNTGNVKDVVELADEILNINDIDDMFTNVLNKNANLKLDDIMFLATPKDHTTCFFARTNTEGALRYYIINSSARTLAGTMEEFTTWDSALSRLIAIWKKPEVVEISAFTIKSKLASGAKQDKTFKEPDVQRSTFEYPTTERDKN